ncbi:MAG TPA: efflux RND transporter periplasmic adaptor subunit [Acidocella sp.]|nr:efflux RND transporter periplasmic adaptor subunit [Acidocella sp.]
MAESVGQRRRIGKRWVFAAVLLLLGLFVWWRHSGPVQQRHGMGGSSVGVAKALSGAMPVVLDELGTVTPITTVTVLPQISGYLTQVAFTEGQSVTAGQFLAQIDPRPYQIQLEQYQAALAKDSAVLGQARSDLERYEKLASQDSISAQQVVDQQFLVAQAEAATKADHANIDTAKLDLIYCHITSPISGRVGLRLVDIGNYVTSGSSTGLAVITSISPTTVIFSVSQTDLAPVLTRLGQGAQLTATAYSSDDTTKLEDGTLSAVDSQIDTATGMVKLRADFPNADGALFPNEFVNVHLLVNTLQNATLVPTQAVQTGAPGTYVYLVQPDDTVHAQPVTTGPTDGTNTVITKGISPGDVVVTDGVDRLSDGMRVHVANTLSAQAGGQTPQKHHHHNLTAAQ